LLTFAGAVHLPAAAGRCYTLAFLHAVARPKSRFSMKRFVRWFLAALALVFAGGAVFLVPTIWGRPWFVDHFYSRVFLEYAIRHPMLLSEMRVLEPMGIDFHSDDLDDLSPEAEQREVRFVEKNLAMLATYSRDGMDAQQRLSAEVMQWFLEDTRAGNEYLQYDYPVNQLFGVQATLPEFLTQTHLIERRRDAEHYVARARKVGPAIDQVIRGLDLREQNGIVPPRFVFDRVLPQMREFITPPAREHALFTHFTARLDSIGGAKGKRRSALEAEMERAIEESIYPAYRRLIARCEKLAATATTDDGVWKFPNGEAFYRQCLRHHTTTDLPPDSIHALGLAEVARLQAEMRRLLERQGVKATDVGAAVEALRAEPRFQYPDEPQSRSRIIADYQTILDDANRRLAPLFDLRPKIGVKVDAIPAYRAATAPGAYYQPASFDGKRPGVFYANVGDVRQVARFGMRTLAYHEGVPGHHYQIGVAQGLEDLPFFRRILPFTAYQEGWALYAERLALEQGFHPTPYDSLGAYGAELFRAARLVVDTGIHHKRWTREQAIDYMTAATGSPEARIRSEIERYVVSPGQACAYKVGQLAILRMRARAQARLGDRFDLRAFHRIVLENGAMPLSILERTVEQWAETRARAAG
jgi:uncharacterized protein (DUF885 family)